jgi:hypothetical protein
MIARQPRQIGRGLAVLESEPEIGVERQHDRLDLAQAELAGRLQPGVGRRRQRQDCGDQRQPQRGGPGPSTAQPVQSPPRIGSGDGDQEQQREQRSAPVGEEDFAEQAVGQSPGAAIGHQEGEAEADAEKAQHLVVDLAEREVGGEKDDVKHVHGPAPAPPRGAAIQPQPKQEEGQADQPDAEHLVIERKAEIAPPFEKERSAIGPGPEVEQQLEQDSAQQGRGRQPPGQRELRAAGLARRLLPARCHRRTLHDPRDIRSAKR